MAENDLKNDIKNWNGNWLFNGEWSIASNVSPSFTDDDLRRYARAQIAAFAESPGGWTYWTWKKWNDEGPRDEWSMKTMLRRGIIEL